MEFIYDLGRFLNAVFWHWQSWLGGSGFGGAIVVGVYVYQELTGRTMPKRMYVALFIVAFLFAAFFAAWRDQYHATSEAERKVTEMEQKFEKLTTPIISGNIQEVKLARGGPQGLDSLMIMSVLVINTGAPTALNVISVTVKANGKESVAEPILLPLEGLTVLDSSGGKRYYPRFNVLPLKLSTPIPTRGQATGFLPLFIPGISVEDTNFPGSIVELKLSDVEGRIYPLHLNLEKGNLTILDMKHLQPKAMQHPRQ